MSVVVSRRLQELAERGTERRRRTSEIRRETALALEMAHGRRELLIERLNPHTLDDAVMQVDDGPSTGILSEVQDLLGRDVLHQVESFLSTVDADWKDHWNEDDTLIAIHLQEALAAALRQGYTIEDLQIILRLLDTPSD